MQGDTRVLKEIATLINTATPIGLPPFQGAAWQDTSCGLPTHRGEAGAGRATLVGMLRHGCWRTGNVPQVLFWAGWVPRQPVGRFLHRRFRNSELDEFGIIPNFIHGIIIIFVNRRGTAGDIHNNDVESSRREPT